MSHVSYFFTNYEVKFINISETTTGTTSGTTSGTSTGTTTGTTTGIFTYIYICMQYEFENYKQICASYEFASCNVLEGLPVGSFDSNFSSIFVMRVRVNMYAFKST